MKKFFVLTTLILLGSLYLFAAPSNSGSILLDLDLSSTTIELIGFDDQIPTITTATLPNDSYLDSSLENVKITPNGETGTSKPVTFYMWWYLYTVNNFKIKCNATNWKGTTPNNTDFIQFDALFKDSDGDEIDSLSIADTANATDSDVVIYTHDNSTGLNVGWASITIPEFNFLDKTKDKYTSTITFTFITN